MAKDPGACSATPQRIRLASCFSFHCLAGRFRELMIVQTGHSHEPPFSERWIIMKSRYPDFECRHLCRVGYHLLLCFYMLRVLYVFTTFLYFGCPYITRAIRLAVKFPIIGDSRFLVTCLSISQQGAEMKTRIFFVVETRATHSLTNNHLYLIIYLKHFSPLIIPSSMSNGIVTGTDSLESRFGMSFLSHSRGFRTNVVLCPASLGINGTRSAYVPPHMRNQQQAAQPPPSRDTRCVYFQSKEICIY